MHNHPTILVRYRLAPTVIKLYNTLKHDTLCQNFRDFHVTKDVGNKSWKCILHNVAFTCASGIFRCKHCRQNQGCRSFHDPRHGSSSHDRRSRVPSEPRRISWPQSFQSENKNAPFYLELLTMRAKEYRSYKVPDIGETVSIFFASVQW